MPYDNVPPLERHTFPNGKVAIIHPVSQFTAATIAAAAQKKIAPIPVPTTTVDMEGKGPTTIENPADPAYQAAVVARNRTINEMSMDGLLDLGMEIEVDQAELGRVKATFERLGLPLDEISDKVAYIKHCCIQDLERDFMPLAKKLRGITEEAIQEQVESFPDHAARQAAEPLQPASVGAALQPDTGSDSGLSLAGHLG